MSARAHRPVRRSSLLVAAALSLSLAGCRCLSCHRELDVYVVTAPSGGTLTLLDPDGSERPPLVEPLRLRRVHERLTPLPGLPGGSVPESAAELLATFPAGATTRGRICTELREAPTADGLDRLEQVFVTRCESDDGGAWWFDGELVRAAAPLRDAARLVVHVGRPQSLRLDGDLLLGGNATWKGRPVRLEPERPAELRGERFVARVRAAAGVCLQIACDPRLPPGTLELSVGERLEAAIDASPIERLSDGEGGDLRVRLRSDSARLEASCDGVRIGKIEISRIGTSEAAEGLRLRISQSP